MDLLQRALDLQELVLDLLYGVLSYVAQPSPPFFPLEFFLEFEYDRNRDRRRQSVRVRDVDIVFVELLRTAEAIDNRLRSKLDALIDVQAPPDWVIYDTELIIHRLIALLDIKSDSYMGTPMARAVDQVTELAEAAFTFNKDNFESLYGFYYIVAVGLLLHLRVSFISSLGFEELPRFNFEGARGPICGALWRSGNAEWIPKDSVALFFARVQRLIERESELKPSLNAS